VAIDHLNSRGWWCALRPPAVRPRSRSLACPIRLQHYAGKARPPTAAVAHVRSYRGVLVLKSAPRPASPLRRRPDDHGPASPRGLRRAMCHERGLPRTTTRDPRDGDAPDDGVPVSSSVVPLPRLEAAVRRLTFSLVRVFDALPGQANPEDNQRDNRRARFPHRPRHAALYLQSTQAPARAVDVFATDRYFRMLQPQYLRHDLRDGTQGEGVSFRV